MNSHKHARLTPKGRALLVEPGAPTGWWVAAASQAAGVSQRTAYKWLARFKAEGLGGLLIAVHRPRSCPHAPSAEEQARFEQLRRELAAVAHRPRGRPQHGHVSRCMKRRGCRG